MDTLKFTRAALAPHPNYVLRSRKCEVCSRRENLRLCENCLVTHYCSQEHETSDFKRHTEKCCYMGGVSWLLPTIHGLLFPVTWTHEEARLLLSKVDIMLHLFPNIAATEMSRRLLVGAYNNITSHDRAWERMYATIADLIPVIDVRQGQEETAYRFIYRHTKDKVDRPIDWIPGLTNFAEAPRSFEEIQGHASLSHQVILTLMAIKALRQVQDIKNLNGFLGPREEKKRDKAIPQEIIDLMCEHLGSTDDLFKKLFGFDFIEATANASWRQKKIKEMRWVVTKCVYEAGRNNKHIWPLMLDTDRLAAPGEFGRYDTGVGWDVREMAEVVAVRQYQVWMETPGSFDILRKAMTTAARWASAEGFCWPIERQIKLDDAEGMPGLHHYHQE